MTPEAGDPRAGGEATLVGSGAFKVDRGRALDKLMRFQLPEPSRFVLPLLRCAVAGGATRISVKTGVAGMLGRSSFELSFNGRAFDKSELEDPYSVLFAKRSDKRARNRELALALLTALRLKKDHLSLISGPPGRRHRLSVESLISEKVQPVEGARSDNIFKLDRGELLGAFNDVAAVVRRSCQACRASILVDGQGVGAAPAPDPETSIQFDEDGVRGWLAVPRDILEESSLRAFTYGIEAGTLAHRLPGAQVEGLVNDDGFTLNASQTGVAKNARFEAAMAVVADQAAKLTVKVLESHRARLEAAAALIRKRGAGAWSARLDGRRDAEAPGMLALLGKTLRLVPDKGDQDLETLDRLARISAWTLEACERYMGTVDKAYRSPLLKALWTQPVFLGSRGEALSQTDVLVMRKRLKFVPVTKSFMTEWMAFPAVWLSSLRVRKVLRRLYPEEELKDISSPAEEPPPAVPPTAAVPESRDVKALAQMGFGEFLIRDRFQSGKSWIEVGIPASLPEKGAKVYVWEDAGPRRLRSSLRLKFVAVAIPSSRASVPKKGPESAGLVLAAIDRALRLYDELAKEYDFQRTDSRTASIRACLLDCLAASVCQGKEAAATAQARAWLAGKALFQTDSGWLDYERLRAFFEEGRVILVKRAAGATGNPGPAIVLVGPEEGDALLRDILPGARFLQVDGKDGVRLAFKETPGVDCRHESLFGCLIEVDAPAVHLTIGEAEGGKVLDLPWGTVTAFGADAHLPGLKAGLAVRADVGLALAAAVVEQHGTGRTRPEGFPRAFLLKAVPRLCAPWKGKEVPASARRLRDLLRFLPFFETPSRAGITLDDLDARLSSGAGVTWAPRGAGRASRSAELMLDETELDAVKRLWPRSHDKLLPAASPPRETPGKDFLSPPEKMLFERRYDEPGLRAFVGLPRRWKDDVELVLLEGKGQRPSTLQPKGLPAVGVALVDLSVSPEPRSLSPVEIVFRLFVRFYSDLLDAWPLGEPHDPRHRAGVRCILRVLELNDYPEKRPEAVLATVLQRMWRLRMLPTQGLELASMEGLDAKAREKGSLPYSSNRIFRLPSEDAWVPVLSKSERSAVSSLVCKRLGVKLRRYEPPQASVPKPCEDLAEPAGEAPESLTMLVVRRVLKQARGKRGVKILPAAVAWWEEESYDQLVLLHDPKMVGVSKVHPLVQAVTGSGLDEARQGYYLASLVFTAANRILSGVTDLDDIRFHESLASVLAAPGGTDDQSTNRPSS